jgi:putative nucleotidyltransferase with HDIG domain
MADQLAVALANSELVDQLHRDNLGTLKAFARAVDAKSHWTAGHSERVTALALAIGRELGLERSELEVLHRGSLLHDVGKIGVPAHLLDKPAQLENDETGTVRTHILIGVRILEPLPAFRDILPMIAQHHEHYDGSGYPYGLAGDEIDLKARILSVADVYDALTSNRPYRAGLPHDRAIQFVIEQAGRKFDPDVVEALLRISEHQPEIICLDPTDPRVRDVFQPEGGEPS